MRVFLREAVLSALLVCLGGSVASAQCGRHCNDKSDPDTVGECPSDIWPFHTEIKIIDYNPNYMCEDPIDVENGCTSHTDGNLPLYQIVGKLTTTAVTVYTLECAGNIVKQTVVEQGAPAPDWDLGLGCTLKAESKTGCTLTTLVPGTSSATKAQVCIGGSYGN